MNTEQIIKRYPRLIRAMQCAAILSTYEAVYCIRDLKRNEDYSGEAVNHFGGTREVLKVAWSIRNHAYVKESGQVVPALAMALCLLALVACVLYVAFAPYIGALLAGLTF